MNYILQTTIKTESPGKCSGSCEHLLRGKQPFCILFDVDLLSTTIDGAGCTIHCCGACLHVIKHRAELESTANSTPPQLEKPGT